MLSTEKTSLRSRAQWRLGCALSMMQFIPQEFSVLTLQGPLLRGSRRPINQSILQQLREGDGIVRILEMLKLRLREVQGPTPWQDSADQVFTHCGVLSWCCVAAAILAADLAAPGAWRRGPEERPQGLSQAVGSRASLSSRTAGSACMRARVLLPGKVR